MDLRGVDGRAVFRINGRTYVVDKYAHVDALV